MPSFRYRGQMEQQIQDLLLHYEQQEGVEPSLNDLMVRLVAQVHRQTFPDQYPAPVKPAIIAWVQGRTKKGEEGYLPVVEGGVVLDYIDDDIDDLPAPRSP